jgi:hypothetical protein
VTDITADPLGGRTKGADGVGNAEIDLPGVGLGGDGVGGRESGLLAKDLRGRQPAVG